MFADRNEAGQELLAHVRRMTAGGDVPDIVVALPRGGLPVGAVIAAGLGIPLDLIIVRKVGVPGHEELAVGAVSNGDDMQVVVNEEIARVLGYRDSDVRKLAEAQLKEIGRRRDLYGAGRRPASLQDKSVIVVDDGVATGATMRCALRLIRKQGAKRIILAVPVAPRDVFEELRLEADEAICLQMPDPFFAVGNHYAEFRQVSDDEVVNIMTQCGQQGEQPQA